MASGHNTQAVYNFEKFEEQIRPTFIAPPITIHSITIGNLQDTVPIYCGSFVAVAPNAIYLKVIDLPHKTLALRKK